MMAAPTPQTVTVWPAPQAAPSRAAGSMRRVRAVIAATATT